MFKIIKTQIIYQIVDSIWGKFIMVISFSSIATYIAYLTDGIKLYAPFSYYIAFCIGIIIALKIINFLSHYKYKNSAEIKFHFYGDSRTPDVISNRNIWRCYNLFNIFNKEQQTLLFTTIFISFDKPVLIGTLKVTSPDITLPIYEVKEYNNIFATIVFKGCLPSGTLVISSSIY